MTEKYKILAKYIKDLSSETPDAETYIFVKDRISKYQLGIDINSKALKNNMIEVDTRFKFHDIEDSKKINLKIFLDFYSQNNILKKIFTAKLSFH